MTRLFAQVHADPAMITAVTAAALGVLGIWQARRRDTTAAETTARDVANRAADAAVGALNAALNRLQAELDVSVAEATTARADAVQLRSEVAVLKAELGELRDDNHVLLEEVRRCHVDKDALAVEVQRLKEALS